MVDIQSLIDENKLLKLTVAHYKKRAEDLEQELDEVYNAVDNLLMDKAKEEIQ